MKLPTLRRTINPDPDDEYLHALEFVVRAVGAWHDAIIMGRFDDIPNKHNRVLNAMTTSCGAEATQTVMHLHLHIVPRSADDGLALPWEESVNGC